MKSKQLKSSELFSYLALIFLMLLMFTQQQLQKNQDTINQKGSEVEKLLGDNEKLEGQLRKSQSQLNELEEQRKGLEEKISQYGSIINSQNNEIGNLRRQQLPASIIIENAGKFAFPSGEATLSKELQQFINNELVTIIENNFSQYDINTIEVIGHTDGQPVNQGNGNLDEKLEQSARNNNSIVQLNPSSNADLGLMRALAVVKHLKQIKRQGTYLQNENINPETSFRVYSAAQLTLPNGKFAEANRQPEEKRRRIEIRFTKIKPTQNFRGQ